MSNNFITNNKEKSLKNRISTLISGSAELKFLVGFFYFSGWHQIYEDLQKNETVSLKILVGLQVDQHLNKMVELGLPEENQSQEEYFSQFMKSMGFAINNAEMDNEEFYTQLTFFIKLLEDKRLIIRKTENPNHAKVYLFHYNEHQKEFNDRGGRFITGSSNLTKAGLQGQEEFNVEISDYGFEDADAYFEDLWEKSIPITETPNGIQVIVDFLKNKSQGAFVTPFEAYALILKTYIDLQEQKKINDAVERLLEKNGFEKYKYQIDAVNQAFGIVEENNGVIIADVVGLGKSVIASLLANQIGKRGLILCPPGLIGSKKDSTGWYEYVHKFELYNWDIYSSGDLENLAKSFRGNPHGYEVVIIDEAHRFRNEDTANYEALDDICRNKQVILLSATPFNNSPADIFSLLKLFIVPGQSTITLTTDLEGQFNAYNYRYKRLSNILKNHASNNAEKRRSAEKDWSAMFGIPLPIDVNLVRQNAKMMALDIKTTISPVTIRRNRIDLKTDFEYKKEIANLSEVKDPEEQFFALTKPQSEFYDKIIKNYFAENGLFKGAIYKPFEYESAEKSEDKLDEDDNRTMQQQRNLYDFMRRILVKRFESSFGAFSKSIDRFLKTNKMVLSFIEKSGRYVMDRKLIENIYNEDEDEEDFTNEEIKTTLEQFLKNVASKISPKHTKIYEVEEFEFKKEFLEEIHQDIKLFELIQSEIEALKIVENDPKREAVLATVKKILAEKSEPKRKIILFTEYTDTVRHLKDHFEKELDGRVMICDGGISRKFAEELDANFNAKYKKQADDFDVLVTSDKLSEGFNLNRAGLIINYDIPWNPTRVIQRVGRINRMSAKVFDELMIYNFFPTEQGADVVKSREIAQQKMFLIHNALGEDAKIFDTEEEPSASGLFSKMSKNPEDEEDVNVITKIRNEYSEISENHPEVIARISNLPNRVKTAKLFTENNVVVLKKKGLALFSLVQQYDAEKPNDKPRERNFEELLDFVKCDFAMERQELNKNFWNSYEEIKNFRPKFNTGTNQKSLEQKASISLKSLLKYKQENLDQEVVSFVNTLQQDIRKYKTLPKYSLRKLVVADKNPDYELLIKNIKDLRLRLGTDYLTTILSRLGKLEDDVIIAVGNYKE